MHYYIDGYNLLFQQLCVGEDLRSQRQALILSLEEKIQFLDLTVTLVFDSQYQPDDGSRSHYKSLEICFTALGQTADEFILHALKGSSSQSKETVVTSDRPLARLCKSKLAEIMGGSEFMLWLNKRCRNKQMQIKEQAEACKSKPISSQPKALRPLIREQVKPIPPIEKSPISTKTSFEACFDSYLEIFEKALPPIKEKPVEKLTAKMRKKKIKKPPVSSQTDPLESDEDRWMRLFTS